MAACSSRVCAGYAAALVLVPGILWHIARGARLVTITQVAMIGLLLGGGVLFV